MFIFICINERFLLARSFLSKFFFGEQDPRFGLVLASRETHKFKDTGGSQTAPLLMFIAFNFLRLQGVSHISTVAFSVVRIVRSS